MGAINTDECKVNGPSPTNLLDFGFRKNEPRIHEAQKPLDLIKYLIMITTQENQIILDPFMGSGTTAAAAKILKRNFIGFEVNPEYHQESLESRNHWREFQKQIVILKEGLINSSF